MMCVQGHVLSITSLLAQMKTSVGLRCWFACWDTRAERLKAELSNRHLSLSRGLVICDTIFALSGLCYVI